MYLLAKIKHNSDIYYEVYEERIKYYYNHPKRFNRLNLTEYILKLYIHTNINEVFPNEYLITELIKIYIKRLYIEYYKYYIKGLINKGEPYIIRDIDIERFLATQNELMHKDYKLIRNYSSLDINLEDYILNIFNNINKIEIFSYSRPNINYIYLFLSRLLDNIIENNFENMITEFSYGHIEI